MAGNPDGLDEAIRLHQSGQLDQAAVRYRAILASQPDQSDALHLLGVLAQQQGRTGEAIDLIERALRLQPSNAVYHSNLGLALRGAGRQAEAAEHLRTAVGGPVFDKHFCREGGPFWASITSREGPGNDRKRDPSLSELGAVFPSHSLHRPSLA